MSARWTPVAHAVVDQYLLAGSSEHRRAPRQGVHLAVDRAALALGVRHIVQDASRTQSLPGVLTTTTCIALPP